MATRKKTSSKKKLTAKKIPAAKKKSTTKKSTPKKRVTKKRVTKKRSSNVNTDEFVTQTSTETWINAMSAQSTAAMSALADQNRAAMKALIEENAAALHALSAQNSAAIHAMSETTARLTQSIDVLFERVIAVESAWGSLEAKLAVLNTRGPSVSGDVDGEVAIPEAFEFHRPPLADISPTPAEARSPAPTPIREPQRDRPVVEVKEAKYAKSLEHLMRIRAANRDYLNKKGTLGTALGFNVPVGDANWNSRKPAIIVFVSKRIHREFLVDNDLIRKELEGDGYRCPISIVVGGRATTAPPVSHVESELLDSLRGQSNLAQTLWCGSQIATLNDSSIEEVGSIGAFARIKDGEFKGILGFITNDHVVLGDRLIFHPNHRGKSVGYRIVDQNDAKSFLKTVDTAKWYGDFAKETFDTQVRVDCEFVVLRSKYKDKIRQELPIDGGRNLGPVYPINLEEDLVSGPTPLIGQRVLKIGRTTGLTHGTIAAFGYEWKNEESVTRYTDLLIAPDRVDAGGGRFISTPFSQPGDSGSLVVLENRLRPVALMWGGFLEKLRSGNAQESWTYATRLDKILDSLSLELVS